MGKLKVSLRLAILSAVLIAFGVALGELGLHNLDGAVTSLETVYKDRVVPMRDLKRIADLYAVNIVDTAHKTRAASITREQALANVQEAEKEIGTLWAAYRQTSLIPAEEKLIAELEPMMTESAKSLARLKVSLGSPYPDALITYAETELYPTIDPLSDRFGKLIDIQLEEAKREFEQAESSAVRTRMLSLALIVASAAIGAGLAYAITRQLGRQLGAEPGDVAAVATQIAEGRLDIDVPLRNDADQGSVMATMHRMHGSLKAMVGGISAAAQQIGASAGQLAESSAEAREMSESQSEAASSMAAAMEQMAVSISHISDNARDAQQMAGKAGESAQHGRHVVDAAVSEMVKVADVVAESAGTIDRLAAESDNIGAIVGVIREIADQTNLLALNAAIEAARAGEQGRGFAVVADEVRKLAERTAHSTGEIVTLVTTIQNESRAAKAQMQAGTAQVARSRELSVEAGGAISQISEVIGDALAAVRSISDSLDEQRSTSTQVANNVERVAHSADESAGSVRSISESARDLQSVARTLNDTVAKFRI